MKCTKCSVEIEPDDEREHLGQVLCEDCYLDAVSTVKTCDPWAVHSAKSLEQHTGSVTITSIQSEILRILKETGPIEQVMLLERLDGKLTMADMEREFASLRHMEKVRGEKKGDKIYIRLW